ncbi:DUF58 domain-containing protein [Cohnella ginsengisoli]|uniref:DUF58 domain-containing protein n=1 Tax=Cohnella ginsengisoli TaxID=425004 RepID=A0A9X4QNT0_9BACL|nr:DUF58 domain-containing protein [Cohnella ginsengisoli]MDG0793143.1 DUF58 domain-containing protein [Cohnella ginsengisoli]
MKRLPQVRFGWFCGILYLMALSFVVFQGGKTSLMLFVIMNGLGLYLLLGRWSGIGGIQGKRALGAGSGQDGLFAAGSRLKVRLQMHVPGFWPLPYVIVRERLVRLSGSDLQEYELSFVPDYKRRGQVEYESAPLRRGRYKFLETKCSTRDIFGLFEHQGAFREELQIKVLPRAVELQEWRHLRKARTGQIEQRASSLWARETTQIDGVRDYIHGDRMSRIHWNATARTGQWKSKEYEREALPRFVIVLDRRAGAYRSADAFELAVSTATSLLNLALRRGMPVGFVSAGKDIAWFGAGKTPVNRELLMEHLVDVEADGEDALDRVLRKTAEKFEAGASYVLVSPSMEDETLFALEGLSARRTGPSHIHIAERTQPPEPPERLQQWARTFRGRQWELCSITRLEDLPKALEAGTA